MKRTLYYTFGNHMHWVDMEWLWGYFVLPASIRDMIDYCTTTGAKGNINFDGIGYERLAVEDPQALSELSAALREGTIEIVGGSYGQPYGLFQGGESNIRQRIYGVRACIRILGVRPRAFWEEEFDFFPQLPQLLTGVGYRYGSLFFQWTWHTPHVPAETVPAVMWEGMDGSQIVCASRNELSIHQWPEDFRDILAGEAVQRMPGAGLVQWLELMPSPDWMCRSELMAPLLKELAGDERFDLRFETLSGYLGAVTGGPESTSVPVRKYSLNDVYHGMSIGKNGDLFRRLSAGAEARILDAEAASTVMGYFGRPYAHWDVYPTWELEEAWRELLSAQHHDNDECEGLCGHVGRYSYNRARELAEHVLRRTVEHFARRSTAPPGSVVVFNPLGFDRTAILRVPADENGKAEHQELGGRRFVEVHLPAFGFLTVSGAASESERGRSTATAVASAEGRSLTLSLDGLAVRVDREDGNASVGSRPLCALEFGRPDRPRVAGSTAGSLRCTDVSLAGTVDPVIRVSYDARGADGLVKPVSVDYGLSLEPPGILVRVHSHDMPTPDPTDAGALRMLWFGDGDAPVLHDHPYGVSEIRPTGTFLRKYPTGDWMTSPQVYEEVEDPFTALTFIDLPCARAETASRMQIIHDGSQGHAFRRGNPGAIETILSMKDPWDEAYFVSNLDARFLVRFHETIDTSDLYRQAQAWRRPPILAVVPPVDSPMRRGETGSGPAAGAQAIPAGFRLVRIEPETAIAGAVYRETPESAAVTEAYGARDVEHPVILRIVELSGSATEATVTVAGTVASGKRTNLLGEDGEPLRIVAKEDRSEFRVNLRPHEIATVYLDIEEARKIPRNLDQHRGVWARAHKGESRDGGGSNHEEGTP